MITMRVNDGIFLVLEPGNIRRLLTGEPITTEAAGLRIGIAYTPDVEWVEKQFRDGVDIFEAVTASRGRRPIDRGTDRRSQGEA